PSVQDVLAAANARLDDWNLRTKTWYFYHYSAGILGVVLNFLIAAFARLKAQEMNWLFWAALAAAVLQAITTFVSAKRKTAAYRAGWRVLWVAAQRLKSNVDPDPSKVMDAIEKGWKKINEGDCEI